MYLTRVQPRRLIVAPSEGCRENRAHPRYSKIFDTEDYECARVQSTCKLSRTILSYSSICFLIPRSYSTTILVAAHVCCALRWSIRGDKLRSLAVCAPDISPNRHQRDANEYKNEAEKEMDLILAADDLPAYIFTKDEFVAVS